MDFGPFEPARGLRFDPSKLLLDPYGRAVVVPKNYSRDAARLKGDNAAAAMRSVVTDPHAYDWEGDVPLKRPWSRTIIYEMHVRGFTAHASSRLAESKRGTYAGLVEKIPYLQQLGISDLYLSPLFRSRAESSHGYDVVDHGTIDPAGSVPAGLHCMWPAPEISRKGPHGPGAEATVRQKRP